MEETKNDEPSALFEKVKLSRGMTGKHGWEISLLGKPEDNVLRLREIDNQLTKMYSGVEEVNQHETKTT